MEINMVIKMVIKFIKNWWNIDFIIRSGKNGHRIKKGDIMDLDLKDKAAVVTAASKGLGRAVAQALAREGAKVAICSRDSGRITETAKELKQQTHADVIPLVCDVTSPDGITAFRDKVIDTFGRADIIFANSGGPPPGRIQDVGPEDFEQSLQLNLMSAIRLIYAFIPFMKENRWGRIIASTSISVKQPIPNLALSNVSRVGVVAFIKTLAREVAAFNITANAVAPGYIMTERVKNLMENRVKNENIPYEQALQEVVAQIPAGRAGEPEEFADLVTFLASERAAYINGETILIDGAMYAGLV
jgi:3-oxoacyl-[acyl-carrier protein] reductase